VIKDFITKFWPFIFVFSAVFVFFVRLIYPQLSVFVTPDFGTSDLLNFNYPFREFLAQSLKSGQLPLWTNLIGSGFPFLAEGQAGTFFFINAIASFLPNVGWGMVFSYLSYFLLAAIGTYLFIRELGLGKWEAVFGSLIFAFSGVNLTHISHPNQLAVVSLIPLQFFLLEKFLKGFLKGPTFLRSDLKETLKSSSWLALFSLVTAQSIFAGYLQPTVYAILALGVYFVLRMFVNLGGFVSPRLSQNFGSASSQDLVEVKSVRNLGGFLLTWLCPIGLFAFSLILAVGLSAIQFLPSWELSQQSSRQGGLPESILKLYPYSPKNLLTFLNPNWFGTPQNGSYPIFSDNWGIYWENSGYIGLIPLGLSAFSLFIFIGWLIVTIGNKCKVQSAKFKIAVQNLKLMLDDLIDIDDRGLIAIFATLLIVALLLTLGKYTPLFALYHWPPLSYFRVPSRWLIIVDFSLAILAAFGLKILLRSIRSHLLRNPAVQRGYTPQSPDNNRDEGGQVRPYLKVLPFVFCLLTLFDLWFYFFSFNPIGSHQEWIQTPPQIEEFLKNLPADQAGQGKDFRYYEVGSTVAWNMTFVDQGWKDNADTYYKLREGLRPSSNILYSLPSAGIYAGLLPKRQSDLINLTDALFVAQPDGNLSITNAAVALLSIQNVKYVVSPFSLLHSDLKPLVSTRFSAPDINFIVYENLKVLPRAYLVDHFRLSFVGGKISNDLEMVKKQLVSVDFNPMEAVILEEDPKFTRAGNLDNSSVTMINDSNEKIQLKVNIPSGNGLLVLADSYYPGWVAKVGGKETIILAANLNQRAIAVPQGEHSVEFSYQPQSFRIGVIVSLISLMVSIGWFILSLRVARRSIIP